MAFKKRENPERSAESPEKLFPLLQRTGKNSPSLWSQQTDLLREYVLKRVKAKDLAIELPTGTGKTLTGLLIADWRRRQGMGRAIFACPTIQLVRQVVAAAKKEGIPVVDLSGSAQQWDSADRTSYERGRATAIVPYSSIFNTSPKLIEADIIIFDDAHAGEQYVSTAYTVEINRRSHREIYNSVLESLAPMMSDERYNQLSTSSPVAGSKQLVDAYFLPQREDLLPALGRALTKLNEAKRSDKEARNQAFSLSSLIDNLSACTLYLSWSKLEVRPPTAPTFENSLFSQANQRVYLSATLGEAGELERAFGRPFIHRLPLPPEAPAPTSGRKFLVFPHLIAGVDPDDFTRELINTSERAIIITSSDSTLAEAEQSIVPQNWEIFRKDDLESTFDDFTSSKNAVAVMANRYDGIDLPGDACRVVALSGFPSMTNLQERFYATRARSSIVSEERVRSRVVQGIGRCTRSKKDWALVIIADAEMTTYLSRDEIRKTLPADLQAEVVFGLDQSETSADDVRENVAAFMAQGDEWLDNGEPEISSIGLEIQQEIRVASPGLSKAAQLEVEALECMWHNDWKGAGEKFHGAAEELGQYQEARGYRATLLFRSAVLMDKAGRSTKNAELSVSADAIAARAVAAAAPGTWMNSFLPFEGREPEGISAVQSVAVTNLSTLIGTHGTPDKLRSEFAAIFEGLSSIDHKAYEPALSKLGLLIGAEALKPRGDGRTDSAWCWDSKLWITLEAKSEHKETGQIGIDDVRQVIGHLKLLSKDRNEKIPHDSATVMISPRSTVKRDAMALATEITWRVSPSLILGMANDIERMWKSLSPLRNIKNPTERHEGILQSLREYRLTPESILDRLTVTPLGKS